MSLKLFLFGRFTSILFLTASKNIWYKTSYFWSLSDSILLSSIWHLYDIYIHHHFFRRNMNTCKERYKINSAQLHMYLIPFSKETFTVFDNAIIRLGYSQSFVLWGKSIYQALSFPFLPLIFSFLIFLLYITTMTICYEWSDIGMFADDRLLSRIIIYLECKSILNVWLIISLYTV